MTDKLRRDLKHLVAAASRLTQRKASPVTGGRLILEADVVALEGAVNRARAALAAAPQPAWNGPGETPHEYSPDYQAMGDCRICGHVWEDHQKTPQPGPSDREALVEVILKAMLGLAPGRSMSNAIADALLARFNVTQKDPAP